MPWSALEILTLADLFPFLPFDDSRPKRAKPSSNLSGFVLRFVLSAFSCVRRDVLAGLLAGRTINLFGLSTPLFGRDPALKVPGLKMKSLSCFSWEPRAASRGIKVPESVRRFFLEPDFKVRSEVVSGDDDLEDSSEESLVLTCLPPPVFMYAFLFCRAKAIAALIEADMGGVDEGRFIIDINCPVDEANFTLVWDESAVLALLPGADLALVLMLVTFQGIFLRTSPRPPPDPCGRDVIL